MKLDECEYNGHVVYCHVSLFAYMSQRINIYISIYGFH